MAADRKTLDVELDAIASSLTAFTAKHGDVFVVVIYDQEGFHEVSSAGDDHRLDVAAYLSEDMGSEEIRTAGGGLN